MLSNHNPDLYTQHRRTNSTPTPRHVAPKVSIPPADPTLQQGSHRRGLTIDQSMFCSIPAQQDNGPVYTNQGPQAQYTIRETQQHAMARPGQHTIQIPQNLIEKEHGQYLTTSPLFAPSLEQTTIGTSSSSANPIKLEIQQPSQHQQNKSRTTIVDMIPSLQDWESLDEKINKDIGNSMLKTTFCSGHMLGSQSLVSVSEEIKRPFTPPAQSIASKFKATSPNK